MHRASGVWWAEVEDVRARIERRRALERAARQRRGLPRETAARRTVTITGRAALPGAHMPVRLAEREASAKGELDGEGSSAGRAPASFGARHRPRQGAAEWLGRRPDRIAAWAVALGFLLVVAGLLSAH
jgi:hypothetical protein